MKQLASDSPSIFGKWTPRQHPKRVLRCRAAGKEEKWDKPRDPGRGRLRAVCAPRMPCVRDAWRQHEPRPPLLLLERLSAWRGVPWCAVSALIRFRTSPDVLSSPAMQATTAAQSSQDRRRIEIERWITQARRTGRGRGRGRLPSNNARAAPAPAQIQSAVSLFPFFTWGRDQEQRSRP